MSQHNASRDAVEQAIADRLSRLKAIPVDASGLDRVFQEMLPGARRSVQAPWFRPMRAVAAVLMVGALASGILLLTTGQQVLASPAVMARMHRDLVAGHVPVTRVATIDEASHILAMGGDNHPDLPQAPDAHVMACCMREIKDRKVACVLLEEAGVPVTMSVANASDMKLPRSPTVVQDGVSYHVQVIDELTMVMTERNQRWVCLISELPAERLISIAGRLVF